MNGSTSFIIPQLIITRRVFIKYWNLLKWLMQNQILKKWIHDENQMQSFLCSFSVVARAVELLWQPTRWLDILLINQNTLDFATHSSEWGFQGMAGGTFQPQYTKKVYWLNFVRNANVDDVEEYRTAWVRYCTMQYVLCFIFRLNVMGERVFCSQAR